VKGLPPPGAKAAAPTGEVGEVVGMASLSVQSYGDLDQSGLLKVPELGPSFLGRALGLLAGQLGASLRRAAASNGDPADAGVQASGSALRNARDGSARFGGAPVPVLANLAVREEDF
jgi:hypothetical protein